MCRHICLHRKLAVCDLSRALQWGLTAAVKEMESKVEDTGTFSALPQEEQQELEQTLSQNSEHASQTLAPGPCPQCPCTCVLGCTCWFLHSSFRFQHLSLCQNRHVNVQNFADYSCGQGQTPALVFSKAQLHW